MAWVIAGFVLGVVFGIRVGVVVWAWALTGIVAGAVSGAVSEAGNELLESFSKLQTFLILAFTSLSGLGLGWLLGVKFLPY
jgi:serine/threonine-protein kinase